MAELSSVPQQAGLNSFCLGSKNQGSDFKEDEVGCC